MRLKTNLFVALVLVLAMGMGCSSGSSSNSSSGGGTPVISISQIVGTWKLVSSSGGSWYQQVVFNSNLTGTLSGGVTPNVNFNWTHEGNQVTMTQGGNTIAIINNVPPNINDPKINTVTVSSGGQTAVYNRA
jgi:hypothetical protein